MVDLGLNYAQDDMHINFPPLVLPDQPTATNNEDPRPDNPDTTKYTGKNVKDVIPSLPLGNSDPNPRQLPDEETADAQPDAPSAQSDTADTQLGTHMSSLTPQMPNLMQLTPNPMPLIPESVPQAPVLTL